MNKIEEINKELEVVRGQISNLRDREAELENKKHKIFDLPKIKEKYLNKYFVYKNNCYSNPSKKSDYWDVFYKIINITDGDIIEYISIQMDMYGRITCEKEKRYEGYMIKPLEEISKEEFYKQYSKIMGIIEERVKNNEK